MPHATPSPRRRPSRLGLALLALPLGAAAALAQGTPAQRAACAPDAMRLCRAEIPDAERVAGCLRRERANLGPACRQVMNGAGRGDVASTGSIGR